MKKTATAEHQLDELVDTAVQHFWSRVLPAEGSEKPWLWTPTPKGQSGASYRDISAQAHCVAAYLMRKGVKKGDVVGVIADQGPFYLAVDLGLQFLGAVNLTLPENISMETLSDLMEKPGMRFVFIQKESVYLGLNQLREVRHLLREVIVLAEEVDNLDPECIVTYDIILNHGKIAWREYADQLRVMKGSVVPTDVYCLLPKNDFRKLAQVSFSDLLRDLDEALAYFSGNGFKTILSMQSPESILERTYGLYAPMLLGIQTWCLPQGTSELSNRVRRIAPQCAVVSPSSLGRLEHELVMTHLSRDGKPRKKLVNAMRVCDKRARFVDEGKKPPLFNRIQHWWLQKTLFKQVRKLLGNRLAEIVCDQGTLDANTFAFFRNAGYNVLRPRKEY